MKTSLRLVAVLCALLLPLSAFANEKFPKERPNERPNDRPKERKTAPLLYELPAFASNDVEVLQIEIAQGSRVLVRETVVVPPGLPENAAIDVLYTHPDELLKLRETEATVPGTLQFIVKAGDRELTRVPLAEIEARSGGLSVENAVGEIQKIEVSAPKKSRLAAEGVYYDPDCVQQCETDKEWCLNEWCDPRGDSCRFCHEWYNDCVRNCPTICTDPRSVTTYETTTFISYSNNFSSCFTDFGSNTMWRYITERYRVNVYERTTNCDYSYTDQWVRSYDIYSSCWNNTYAYCVNPGGNVPYPRC